MKAEKIIISFIAVAVGILAASVGFYFYQSSKVVPFAKTKTVSVVPPSPSPTATIFLSVDSPKDEEVVDKRTLTITGKTAPDAVVIISTESSDDIVKPVSNGNFSATATIGDETNRLEITAISPNGDETKVIRTVTFSTENF